LFTGLIKEVGVVVEKKTGSNSATLKIKAGLAGELKPGDSVAVNGVCLTAVSFGDGWFAAEVMPETWRATNLSLLQPGAAVNLEPALAMGERFGGHLVSGHVDGLGKVIRISNESNAVIVWIQFFGEWAGLAVKKGSIAVNGVSLTIQEAATDRFMISLIPHTLKETTFYRLQTGAWVNLEFDQLLKYASNFKSPEPKKGITRDFLKENGFI